jgi:hypothetical protein
MDDDDDDDNNNNNNNNWKCPGNDKIPNYWTKVFPATHSYIAVILRK